MAQNKRDYSNCQPSLSKIRPFTLGAKVDSSHYCDIVLNKGLLPEIQKLSGNNFTFQQDGAPAHRSRQTVAFLHLHVPEFVENWPLYSPDLNPVDYSIWGTLQQFVYRRRH